MDFNGAQRSRRHPLSRLRFEIRQPGQRRQFSRARYRLMSVPSRCNARKVARNAQSVAKLASVIAVACKVGLPQCMAPNFSNCEKLCVAKITRNVHGVQDQPRPRVCWKPVTNFCPLPVAHLARSRPSICCKSPTGSGRATPRSLRGNYHARPLSSIAGRRRPARIQGTDPCDLIGFSAAGRSFGGASHADRLQGRGDALH